MDFARPDNRALLDYLVAQKPSKSKNTCFVNIRLLIYVDLFENKQNIEQKVWKIQARVAQCSYYS